MSIRLLVTTLLVAAIVLSGCAPVDDYGSDGGLTVSVVQGRDDRGARIVGIRLTNTRTDSVTITRAELSTAQLSDPAVWERSTTLRPGLTVDLRMQLGDPACPLADDITPSVTVHFATDDGVARTVTGEPEQPSGVLTRISAEDCLIAGVLAQADISVASVEYTPGSGQPAVLVLAITPSDADGRVTITAVTATVLLGLVDPSGSLSQRYELGRVLEQGGDTSDLRIALVPNRCDPHAVAEDKRGTFIPLEVSIEDGPSGTYYVAMPDDEKGELYAFIPDYCAS